MTPREQQQAARIRELTDENERLRDRLRAIEDGLVAGLPIDLAPCLTHSESLILSLLLKRETVTRDMAISLLHDDRGGDLPDVRTIDSHIKRIRKKLPQIDIETVYGVGWRLRNRAEIQTSTKQAAPEARI